MKRKLEFCDSQLRGWTSKRSIDFPKEVKQRRESMKLLLASEPTTENITKMRTLDNEIGKLESWEEVYWLNEVDKVGLKTVIKILHVFTEKLTNADNGIP